MGRDVSQSPPRLLGAWRAALLFQLKSVTATERILSVSLMKTVFVLSLFLCVAVGMALASNLAGGRNDVSKVKKIPLSFESAKSKSLQAQRSGFEQKDSTFFPPVLSDELVFPT